MVKPQLEKIGMLNLSLLRSVWYCYLNNSFYFLVFKQHYMYFHTLFHSHVFLQNNNNVTKIFLPNRPLVFVEVG